MLLVEGQHCANAVQECLEWNDPPHYHHYRCARYQKPATCISARKPLRYCIDRDEYAEPGKPGQRDQRSQRNESNDAMPLVNKSWIEAKALCRARGARLCKNSEWEFACEGPEMNPYPYGFERDASLCNIDRSEDLGEPGPKRVDHRAPVSAYPGCLSFFGVHNMVGNVDEWVERDDPSAPNRAALRGGWWAPGRNRCRAATTTHAETYSGKQVGFRCCRNAR
jgi:formylglycine-generating enzyme required for sulfatase activity